MNSPVQSTRLQIEMESQKLHLWIVLFDVNLKGSNCLISPELLNFVLGSTVVVANTMFRLFSANQLGTCISISSRRRTHSGSCKFGGAELSGTSTQKWLHCGPESHRISYFLSSWTLYFDHFGDKLFASDFV